jgi:hypothetical protein
MIQGDRFDSDRLFFRQLQSDRAGVRKSVAECVVA